MKKIKAGRTKKDHLNKKKNESSAKNITISILNCLFGFAEAFVVSMDRKQARKAIYGHYENEFTYENISKYFHSLKKRGFIEYEQSSKGESIRFTNKAKMALLDQIAEKTDTDTFYHFISFDIPEKLRPGRDGFRRSIKRIGFREVQKSLWVTKRKVGDLVDLIAEEYKVTEYVVYLVVQGSNIDESIEKILANN